MQCPDPDSKHYHQLRQTKHRCNRDLKKSIYVVSSKRVKSLGVLHPQDTKRNPCVDDTKKLYPSSEFTAWNAANHPVTYGCKCAVCYHYLDAPKGTLFFCFSLTRTSCMRPAGKKTKNTLSTRGCSFWVPLNTRGGLTRTPHGENTHTEHERVQF